MNSGFYGRGLGLEEAFFRKRDAELLEQHRKLEKMKRTRESLQKVSGINNPKVLDKLIELEVSTALLSSIAVVPLVEIAWADGSIDEDERKVILAVASENGFEKRSVDYALLDAWLKHRPSPRLLEAWVHYIQGICEVMTPGEKSILKVELLGRARKVAEASGGILGLAFKMSGEERAVLKKMEAAFGAKGLC